MFTVAKPVLTKDRNSGLKPKPAGFSAPAVLAIPPVSPPKMDPLPERIFVPPHMTRVLLRR